MNRRVCLIGLDCAAPELVFDRWAGDLPNLQSLMRAGIYGSLKSTVPPITVPAWTSMMTGQDPGRLGIYGFRNRADHSYGKLNYASSRMVREPALWDILSARDRRVIVVGEPLTYPPKPVNGLLVTGFLAPDTESEYTYPASLKEEIRQAVGDYMLDVRDFRTDSKEALLSQIYAMTRQRFQLASHLAQKHPWDFFMMIEMGPDRIHHGFWKYFDQTHPKYEPGNPYENAIRDYYRELDSRIGGFLSAIPEDALILVASDHGAKRMEGGICFNEWLIREGYLALKTPPAGVTKIEKADIDWSRTRAWGDGGYYGRLFLNARGREPEGVIDPADYEAVRDEMIARLEALTDEEGQNIGTRVFRPQEIYTECRNIPPDLIVYFGDLTWRSVGSIGHGSIWTRENDTGPDDANHSQHGLFILSDRKTGPGLRREGAEIYDILPSLLTLMGEPVPKGLRGKAIEEWEAVFLNTNEHRSKNG
ncbi:MAG: alkaline phosphatase family protein [Armatimonadetes bacterium]|nr:alkaline phosphatase family protein [Armatimonadota bacterium]